jgi:hypothetical protein
MTKRSRFWPPQPTIWGASTRRRINVPHTPTNTPKNLHVCTSTRHTIASFRCEGRMPCNCLGTKLVCRERNANMDAKMRSFRDTRMRTDRSQRTLTFAEMAAGLGFWPVKVFNTVHTPSHCFAGLPGACTRACGDEFGSRLQLERSKFPPPGGVRVGHQEGSGSEIGHRHSPNAHVETR